MNNISAVGNKLLVLGDLVKNPGVRTPVVAILQLLFLEALYNRTTHPLSVMGQLKPGWPLKARERKFVSQILFGPRKGTLGISWLL